MPVKPGPRPGPKQYAERHNMTRALRNAGILGVPHEVEEVFEKGRLMFRPIFLCDRAEDVTELTRRGFVAKKVSRA